MKRIKITLVSLAILTALTGAYSTRVCQSCAYHQQYKLENNTYVPAGDDGIDYICWDIAGVCTWYRPSPSGGYVPCKNGYYLPLN